MREMEICWTDYTEESTRWDSTTHDTNIVAILTNPWGNITEYWKMESEWFLLNIILKEGVIIIVVGRLVLTMWSRIVTALTICKMWIELVPSKW